MGGKTLRSFLLAAIPLLLVVMSAAHAQGTGSKQCYFGVCSDGSPGPPGPAPHPTPSPPTRRDGACVVTDPTGTPLNVRAQPQGPVVSTLENGVVVRVARTANDYKGQPWAYIVSGDGREQLGWVIRRFLRCS